MCRIVLQLLAKCVAILITSDFLNKLIHNVATFNSALQRDTFDHLLRHLFKLFDSTCFVERKFRSILDSYFDTLLANISLAEVLVTRLLNLKHCLYSDNSQ